MHPDEMRIVAAAVKVGDKIFQGKRHGQIMHAIQTEIPGTYVTQQMQGFVANDGKFYNRFQSGAIAFRSGQTKTRKQSLLSEDVW